MLFEAFQVPIRSSRLVFFASETAEIPGSRNGTAIALAFAFVLPNVILLASDYFEMAVLEMGFYIRYHLRVNLFRKDLRYTEESRAQVPIQVLKISIMEDIPELVAQGAIVGKVVEKQMRTRLKVCFLIDLKCVLLVHQQK